MLLNLVVMGLAQDRDVVLNAQHAEHELLQVGAMVLAVAVGQVQFRSFLVRLGSVVTPDADRSRIPVAGVGVEIKDNRRPARYFAEGSALSGTHLSGYFSA